MTERYGWSKLNCMELADTPSVAREHESQKILTEVHNHKVVVRYLKGSKDKTHWSSGILVEQEEDLGANSGEKVDLTSVHGQPRCCVPLHVHSCSFHRYEKGSPGPRKTRMLVRAQSIMGNGALVSKVQGKYGVEDLDVMHCQPEDERHGEVFRSNTPYVEHQGFLKEDTVLMVPSWYKGFEQQRKCPKGGGEGLPGGSQPPWGRRAGITTMVDQHG